MGSLIISADDFGKSASANKNILKLAKLSKIQRVSVMVNGKFSSAEIKKLLLSKVLLDIHLTLSSDTMNFESGILNIDQDSKFKIQNSKRLIKFIILYLTRRIKPNKVLAKWDKQIDKFVNIFNKTPDGLNSHEHIHFFPPYFKIALKLCEKYKISHIRYGNKGILANNNKVGRIIKILNQINKKFFTSYKLQVTSYKYLVSLDWLDNPKEFLQNLPHGSTEIVCHPERREEFEKISQLTLKNKQTNFSESRFIIFL